jgi:hypothetical protein
MLVNSKVYISLQPRFEKVRDISVKRLMVKLSPHNPLSIGYFKDFKIFFVRHLHS